MNFQSMGWHSNQLIYSSQGQTYFLFDKQDMEKKVSEEPGRAWKGATANLVPFLPRNSNKEQEDSIVITELDNLLLQNHLTRMKLRDVPCINFLLSCNKSLKTQQHKTAIIYSAQDSAGWQPSLDPDFYLCQTELGSLMGLWSAARSAGDWLVQEGLSEIAHVCSTCFLTSQQGNLGSFTWLLCKALRD